MAVTPDVARVQMEDAVMFSLTATPHGDLHLDNGEFRESNFHGYSLLHHKTTHGCGRDWLASYCAGGGECGFGRARVNP